jgi:hypothetical protein
VFLALLCLVVAGSNSYILLTTSGEATADVADVPIVPGALVNANGHMSGMLADRVKEASLLWPPGEGEQDPRVRGPRDLGIRRARHDAQGPGP